MRKCCIKDCSSCELDKERHLFEISAARKEWINIIKIHQQLNENNRLYKLYVCDLHFNSESIQRHKTKITLHRNAVPNFNSNDSNENNQQAETGEETCQGVVEEANEEQWKMISLEEYENLIQLIPQVEMLKNTIDEMTETIKSKDSQLEDLQRVHQSEKAKCINVSNLSTEQREVIDCLVNGNKGKTYSENVRIFSLNQQYYSTAAYLSLRLFFNKNLPAIRTLQMWYTSIDGNPGISESALDILREKSESYLAKNHHELHVCMISDETSIKKDLCFSAESQSFIGFSTITNSSQPNENEHDGTTSQLKLAKDALVFLVVGPDFKIPVAYEFLNGLESHDRAAITLRAIKSVEAAGPRVVSLTTDALIANITTAEALGANIDEGKPYFISPTHPEQKIYIILDPPHMLKLIRKHFCSNMIYYQDELVNWELLKILVEKQSTDNFNLCNKLTKKHINWHQNPMNVKLAAETISNSVADALHQLHKDGYEEFANTKATVEFLRFFNNAFDILNFAENKESDGRFKRKLCANTADNIFEFGEIFKRYLSELELRKKTKTDPILVSSADRGFLGFYIDFVSLKGIFEDFVQNGPLEVFYPFQFSQDHLESFFSLIRNSLGSNDNPNAIEFKSAFRKLLICHPVMTSADHNVISNATGILTVSSKNKKKPLPSTTPDPVFELEVELDYENIMLVELDSMDPYNEHMCAYVASCIEEKLHQSIRQHKYKCIKCADVLYAASDKMNNSLIQMKEKVKQPSASTFKLVIFANAIMKMYSTEHQQGNNFNAVWKTIRENLDLDDVYKEFYLEQHEEQESTTHGHKLEFISQLVKIYMTMKSQKIGTKITDEERGELIRQRKKREYILAGQ